MREPQRRISRINAHRRARREPVPFQDQVAGGEAAPTLCRRKVDARAVMADVAVCRARIQP